MPYANKPERAVSASGSGHFALIKSHGGSGASVLARLLDPEGLGFAVEITAENSTIPQGALPVVMARSTGSGTEAAARMLAGWSSPLPAPALVLVADAPLPEPRIVSYLLQGISEKVRAVVKMPYLFDLREAFEVSGVLVNPHNFAAVERVRRELLACQEIAEVSS